MFMSSEWLHRGIYFQSLKLKDSGDSDSQAAPSGLPQKWCSGDASVFSSHISLAPLWLETRETARRKTGFSPPLTLPGTPPHPHPPAPDLREKREEVTANNRLSSTLPQTFLLCSWLTRERRWQDAHGWRHRKHTRVHEMHSYTPRYTHTVFNCKTFICFPEITEFKPQQL